VIETDHVSEVFAGSNIRVVSLEQDSAFSWYFDWICLTHRPEDENSNNFGYVGQFLQDYTAQSSEDSLHTRQRENPKSHPL
jgi:S-formylglutathione hydrolase FrmB